MKNLVCRRQSKPTCGIHRSRAAFEAAFEAAHSSSQSPALEHAFVRWQREPLDSERTVVLKRTEQISVHMPGVLSQVSLADCGLTKLGCKFAGTAPRSVAGVFQVLHGTLGLRDSKVHSLVVLSHVEREPAQPGGRCALISQIPRGVFPSACFQSCVPVPFPPPLVLDFRLQFRSAGMPVTLLLPENL